MQQVRRHTISNFMNIIRLTPVQPSVWSPPPPLSQNSVKQTKKEKKQKKKGNTKPKKQKIPAALREQVWLQHQGQVFNAKCMVTWCQNIITVYNFQCGHDIPESKGGVTDITNLYPICAKCNLSMGNQYTLKEWSALYNAVSSPSPIQVQPAVKRSWYSYLFSCFK